MQLCNAALLLSKLSQINHLFSGLIYFSGIYGFRDLLGNTNLGLKNAHLFTLMTHTFQSYINIQNHPNVLIQTNIHYKVFTAPSYQETPVCTALSYQETPVCTAPSYQETPVCTAPSYQETPVCTAPSYQETPVCTAPSYQETPVCTAPSYLPGCMFVCLLILLLVFFI